MPEGDFITKVLFAKLIICKQFCLILIIFKMKKVIILLLIFVVVSRVYSSGLSARISGTVTEEDGTPIQYANIILTEIGIFTTTESKGHYEFTNVPYGNYLLTFSRTGYKTKILSLEIKQSDVNYNTFLENTLIETPTIDVTSSFEAQDISNSTFSISTIDSKKLTGSSGEILSSVISDLPGVNSITTGISIGKPVIRGLTSNRVLILNDGVKQEAQQWGDEHSAEISLYDLDRIEILRGPVSLLYGSDGLGGVVNIISKPFQFANLSKPIYYGNIDFGGFSVNNEGSGNLNLGIGLKNLGFKGNFGYRNSGNIKTPDGTFLVNTLNPSIKDTIRGGGINNTGTNEIEGGLSFGFNGNFGNINAGFKTFNRENQIRDPDPFTTPSQKVNTHQFEMDGNINLGKKFQIEPVVSFLYHSRKEFESLEDKDNNIPSVNFLLKTFQSDVRLHNTLSKNLSGTFGISAEINDNQSLGEKLIPNYHSVSYGIYALEKYQFGKWVISFGGRFDNKSLNIRSTVVDSSSTINPQTLTFNAFSGSTGLVYRPIDNLDLFANIGRGWRPPSEFEMFTDSKDEGTGRYVKGIITLNPNAAPNPETSLNLDFGIRTHFKIFNAEISFFHNIINDFIYQVSTNTIDSASGFPIFNIKQYKSTFTGIEYCIQIQPLNFLLLSLNGDYMTTKNNATNNPLPFSPPAKNIIEVKLQKSNLGILYNPHLNLSAKIVSAQNDVDQFETTTDGYTLFNGGFGSDFVFSKTIASVDFFVDNIANTKYVDHLSRYKNYALNPGRSINLKLSVPFQF